jgi:hypothetical protein
LLLPGFLEFIGTDDAWRWKDPAILMLLSEDSHLHSGMNIGLNVSFATNFKDFEAKSHSFARFEHFSQFLEVISNENQVCANQCCINVKIDFHLQILYCDYFCKWLVAHSPESVFDCSCMNAGRLAVNVLTQAITLHPGRMLAICALCHLSLRLIQHSEASAAASFLGLSYNNLCYQDLTSLLQLLTQFSSLKNLDISNNPELGDAGVLSILSALTGTCTRCSLCRTVVHLYFCLFCSVAKSTADASRSELHRNDKWYINGASAVATTVLQSSTFECVV